MTFLELLNSGVELDIDLIIGDVDMPATFVWDSGMCITDYAIDKYGDILNAEITVFPECIEIHCDDDALGEEFVMVAAGYCGELEWNSLFKPAIEVNDGLDDHEEALWCDQHLFGGLDD